MKCARFVSELDHLADKYQLIGDHDFERILFSMTECIEEEMKHNQQHPLVINLLGIIKDGLRHLAMDYYVSYK